MHQDYPNQHLINAFTVDNKVNTLHNLLDCVNHSEVTLRRKIKRIGLLVSYNFNSKFYSLPSLASFNAQGIWNCDGICFSKHGSLVKTVKKLVYNSRAGYTSMELSEILFVRVNDLLRIQTSKQGFRREKEGRSYVYYSGDEAVFAAQYKERQLLTTGFFTQKANAVLEDKDIVIAILIEIIQSGNLSEEALSQHLMAKSVDVGISEIRAVIFHYGIKKTMHKS
jgi:hypothetical protein